MSVFHFIGNIFKPASDLIDALHVSDEERMTLSNQLAQIEAKVSIKIMELQQASIEANAKIATAQQQYGNWYVKGVRPTISLVCAAILIAMGFEVIVYNELLLQICGMYLGIYSGLRTYEKKFN